MKVSDFRLQHGHMILFTIFISPFVEASPNLLDPDALCQQHSYGLGPRSAHEKRGLSSGENYQIKQINAYVGYEHI